MPAKVRCLKYYRRNDVGIFWQPGEIYEFDLNDVYEFIRNFHFENWLDSESSEFGEFVAVNIGTFSEYFEPVDIDEFDRTIRGKRETVPLESKLPERILYDDLTLGQLIAKLLEVQSQVGADAKVFVFDTDMDWYISVKDTTVQVADDSLARLSDSIELGETFVQIDI